MSVVRALAIAFVLQLSGAVHLAIDLFDPDADHCGAGCEDQGRECTPFCATCSCTHAGPPLVTPARAPASFATVAFDEIGYTEHRVLDRAPDELFRPPRA